MDKFSIRYNIRKLWYLTLYIETFTMKIEDAAPAAASLRPLGLGAIFSVKER